MISDVNNRIDEALSEMISKRISDEIDARVRRCDPTLKDFEQLFAEGERLLASILECNPGKEERIEGIFRKQLQ